MKSKNRILIVDGDNLCHRAYHKFKGLTSPQGESTSVIYGFLYILQSMIRRMSSDKVYVTFDGGKSPHRLDVLRNYKNREKNLDLDYEDLKHQKHLVSVLLTALNVEVLLGDKQEADDLICMVISKLGSEDNYITILSSDKDFMQLLGPNIKIFNPFKNALVTEQSLMDDTGYTPLQHKDFLILDGDKSDKIPGVPGMGKVRIKKFMDLYGSVENYLDNGEEDGWVYDVIAEVYDRNDLLINLRLYYVKYLRKLSLKDFVPVPRAWNISVVHTAMAKYGINLFTKPEVIKTFKNLK